MRLDVRDRVFHASHLSRILVRDVDVGLILKCHQELEGIKRVGPEIVTE